MRKLVHGARQTHTHTHTHTQAAAGFWRTKYGLWGTSNRQLGGGEYDCTYYSGTGGDKKVTICGIRDAGHTTGARTRA